MSRTQIFGNQQIEDDTIVDADIASSAAIQLSKLGTGNLTLINQGSVIFKELTANGTDSVTIEAPDNVTTSYTLKLPLAQSSGTQVLTNDGSGNLSWTTGSSGANTALSNLASVAINTALLPTSSNTIALGSTSLPFSTAYLKTSLVLEQTSAGTNAVTLTSPSSVTSYSLILPTAQASSGQTLQNDGSGNLSWTSSVSPFRENYVVGTALNNYTGSTTVFNLVNSYTVGGKTLIVTVDGVTMTPGSGIDYLETNSTTVTFNNALVTGQKVSFIFSQPANVTTGIVNSGTAGRFSLYNTGGTTVSDTYVQNTHNITLAIVAQGSRSADLALTIPNPGNAVTSSNIILDQGATFAANVAMGSNKITGLANGTASGDAAAFGQIKVVQTVTTTNSTAANAGSSQTYIDSGLTASITPTSSSNKIRVTFIHKIKCSQTSNPSTDISMKVKLLRGATSILETFNALGFAVTNSTFTLFGTYHEVYLDSPATTSSITYKTQVANTEGAGSVTTCPNGSTDVETIILEEIAA